MLSVNEVKGGKGKKLQHNKSSSTPDCGDSGSVQSFHHQTPKDIFTKHTECNALADPVVLIPNFKPNNIFSPEVMHYGIS